MTIHTIQPEFTQHRGQQNSQDVAANINSAAVCGAFWGLRATLVFYCGTNLSMEMYIKHLIDYLEHAPHPSTTEITKSPCGNMTSTGSQHRGIKGKAPEVEQP